MQAYNSPARDFHFHSWPLARGRRIKHLRTTHCISRPLRSRSRPSESFLRLRTMDSFPDRCFVLKKDGGSPSIFTTTRTLRSSCIGTVKRFPSMWTEPPKKAQPLFLHRASGGSPLLQARLGFGSITRTIARAPTWPPDSTEEKSGLCTSNPLRNRAVMTAKSSLS